MTAPVPAPTAAPMAAPVPPPAIPPTMAPRPAPPPTLRAVFLPSPEPFDSTGAVTMSYLRPPKEIEFAFSVILSAPFILPACSTLAACSTTFELRGMITFPFSITGSSRSALNVMPACAASTSMACVSSTLSIVPAGTVTGFGATVGFGTGAGAGGALRGVNSTALTPSTGNSSIDPLAISSRTILTSALMNEPLTTLPDRSVTLSADSVAPARARRVESRRACVRMTSPSSRRSLGERQRRRYLQIEEEQDLILDLHESSRGFRRERRLDAIVVGRLERLPASLEVERAF